MINIEEFVAGGTGLYTLREAARYARISPVTVSRWFKGSPACHRVFNSLEDGERVITFLDFIQLLAVRNLRVHYRVKLQTIRDAVEKAVEEHEIDHPFARPHQIYVFDKQLWISPTPAELVQLSGHEQKGFVQVIEPFMKDVSFDRETHLATKYQAYCRDDIKIVMNPKIRFGEPMLECVGYTPEALYEAAKTEGSAETAAKSYGVTKAQVEACIEYFDQLQAA